MANVQAAMNEVRRIEGDYAKHPADLGGETFFGISERYGRKPFERLGFDWPPKEWSQAENFYRWQWLEWGMDVYPDGVAALIYVLANNMGWDDVGPLLQRALTAATRIHLEIDGDIGRETLRVLFGAPREPLIAAIRSEAAAVYRYEKSKAPGQEENAAGWKAMAYGLR